jgi:hypothetical protein
MPWYLDLSLTTAAAAAVVVVCNSNSNVCFVPLLQIFDSNTVRNWFNSVVIVAHPLGYTTCVAIPTVSSYRIDERGHNQLLVCSPMYTIKPPTESQINSLLQSTFSIPVVVAILVEEVVKASADNTMVERRIHYRARLHLHYRVYTSILLTACVHWRTERVSGWYFVPWWCCQQREVAHRPHVCSHYRSRVLHIIEANISLTSQIDIFLMSYM